MLDQTTSTEHVAARLAQLSDETVPVIGSAPRVVAKSLDNKKLDQSPRSAAIDKPNPARL